MPRSVLIVTAVLLAGGASVCMGKATFADYEVILTRRPFGEPPAKPAPDAASLAPKPAGPSFTKALTMCAITDSENGVRVGIINKAMKPWASYYLRLGEIQDGIELVDADFESEGALLRKGTEEEWVYMDGGSASGDGPAGAPSSRGGAGSVSTTRTSMSTATPAAAKPTSYAERLRRRREELRKRALAAQQQNSKLSPDDLKKQLQEYQMQLIRDGKKPLPIPLTPEMDAKLVQEGVLPPVE